MIKAGRGRLELGGSIEELTQDYLILTHAIIDNVIKQMPREDREAFKCALILAIHNEMGVDVLAKADVVKNLQVVDLSDAMNLKRRADNETDR